MISNPFNNWKSKLLTQWNLTRILRLALSLIILFEAFKSLDILLGLLAIILLAQALLNAGCCGASGCNTSYPVQKLKPDTEKDTGVTFEEIK